MALPCRFRVGRYVRCNDHIVTIASLLHPFTNDMLRLLILICIGRVNKVATGLKVSTGTGLMNVQNFTW